MDADPVLDDLAQQRARLYAELADTGDFRRGSISENYRRCGKPNCACAQSDHPGHGPRHLVDPLGRGGKIKGRQLAPSELGKVGRGDRRLPAVRGVELAGVEVSEGICEARPAGAPAQTGPRPAKAQKGPSPGSRWTSPPS